MDCSSEQDVGHSGIIDRIVASPKDSQSLSHRKVGLPPHVHKQITRHGRVVFYFRRGHGPRVRLPPPNDQQFPKMYAMAMAGPRAAPYDGIDKQRIEAAVLSAMRGAKARSRRMGVAFNLNIDWLLAKVEEQQFRCAVTGFRFFETYSGPGRLSPFIPSIDRINAGEGYTFDNVRIVTLGANTMLHDWGDGIAKRFSRRLVRVPT